jgi:hypothetical protein
MARTKGSKNKPKDNGGAPAAEHVDADAIDPTDAIETMAARTLRGDIRDALLTEFKATPVAWSFMTEAEQERVIHRCTDIAESIVNRAITIAASETVPHVAADVSQFTVKDGLKVQLAAAGTVDNINALAVHRGAAVLVLIDPRKYMGQRKAAKPEVVGSLRMPMAPESPGVHGDELPGEGDGLDIPPGLRRLPPPLKPNPPPFNDFDDEGPRHV